MRPRGRSTLRSSLVGTSLWISAVGCSSSAIDATTTAETGASDDLLTGAPTTDGEPHVPNETDVGASTDDGASESSANGTSDGGSVTGAPLDDEGETETALESGDTEMTSCLARCLRPAPESWTGPVWVGASSSVLECNVPAPTLAITLGIDLVVPSSTCECTCAASPVLTCGVAAGTSYEESGCLGQQTAFAPVADVCSPFSNVELIQLGQPEGGCGTPQRTEQIPPAFFANIVTACAGVDQGGCTDSRLCVAPPSEGLAQACIYKSGENECPGEYPAQFVYYSAFVDTRSCSSCTDTCAASDFDCHLAIEEFSEEDCVGTPTTVELGTASFPAECREAGSYRYLGPVTTEPGRCTTPDPVLSGAVTPTDPVTMCCLPGRPLFW